jgi:hypothetical protein
VVTAVAAAMAGGGACDDPPPGRAPIRLLHTFATRETELVNAQLAERGIALDASLVPFARGQQVIGEVLRAGRACPAAVRIDATWLPELVEDGLLAEVPADLAALDWLPEAERLGRGADGRLWAVPQTVDGLVVVRRVGAPAPADDGLPALIAAARAARSAMATWPLGLRADGYWLVPWLRARGADLAPRDAAAATPAVPSAAPTADPDADLHALEDFAGLFGTLAPPPPPAGGEAPDELARWDDRQVAYWVTGPWVLAGLADRDILAVTGLRHAPRGGQLLVVPRCAPEPAAGWKLIRELTDVPLQLAFATSFASVPTRRAALAGAPPLVVALHAALASAEALPRTALTPRLFDDLNPALAAVVSHDATAAEAIAGVRRGWARLAARRRPQAAP